MKKIFIPLTISALAVFQVGCMSTGDTGQTTQTPTTNIMDGMLGSNNPLTGSPLTSMLSSKLSLSNTQAAGGLSALLGTAQNNLSTEQSSELSSLIPGMSTLTGGSNSSLISQLGSMSDVANTFQSLGIDSSMISQFSPVILEYLGGQGASSGLMSALTKLWV